MTTPVPADLLLPHRTGVSAEIAVLRAAYPQPVWRAHANFGELSAFWLQVHDSLRAQAGQLHQLTHGFRDDPADPAAFQRLFVPRLNQFLQHLNGHHQIEDAAYFPKFRALDPRMAAAFDLLESDHAIINDALLGAVDSARALLAALPGDADPRRHATEVYADAADRLQTLLERHLADEEEIVIPAMLEHGERSVG